MPGITVASACKTSAVLELIFCIIIQLLFSFKAFGLAQNIHFVLNSHADIISTGCYGSSFGNQVADN